MTVNGVSASVVGASTAVLLAAARIGNAQPAGPPPPAPGDQPADATAQQQEPAQPAPPAPTPAEPTLLPDAPPAAVAPAKETIEPTAASNAATGGFALEVHLDNGELLDSNSMTRTTQAGFFLGHRGTMTTLGVGFDFGHISDGTMFSGATQSSSMLMVMPGLRLVLARTDNERTELIGQLDAGYGRIWSGGDMKAPSVDNVRIQLAPGLRYWLAPSFAIGGAAGLRYELYAIDAPGSSTAEVVAVFSSIQLTGVF